MKLIVQPDEGATPVIEFIRSARTSLILKQFTFTHPEILQALLETHVAGVAVRVELRAGRLQRWELQRPTEAAQPGEPAADA